MWDTAGARRSSHTFQEAALTATFAGVSSATMLATKSTAAQNSAAQKAMIARRIIAAPVAVA